MTEVQKRTRAVGDGVSREAGRRIRELRERQGLRLVDLAATSRIPYQVLSKIELGERRLSVDELMALVPALKTTSTAILGLWS